MSQLSPEQQLRVIVKKAKFDNPEIDMLVSDVAHIDVNLVAQCAEGMKCNTTATPRDVERAGMVLDFIERSRRRDEQHRSNERAASQNALTAQVANSLQRSNLK